MITRRKVLIGTAALAVAAALPRLETEKSVELAFFINSADELELLQCSGLLVSGGLNMVYDSTFDLHVIDWKLNA